jgi:iron complex outermembrane recepter protein
MRLSVAMAVAWLSVSILSAAETAQAAVRQSTNIPAQALGTALQALAKQRAFQVVYLSDAVDTMKTEGASGELTPDEALKQLLSGTGLTYRYLDESTVTVYPADAPQAMNGNSGALSGLNPVVPTAGMRLAQDAQATESTQSPNSQTSSNSSVSSETDEDESVKLEEIIVTAQRREQGIQDVTGSVTAFMGAQLEEVGATDIKDILRSVPGLSFEGTDRNQSNYAIRGIATQLSQTVGIFLDDVPLSNQNVALTRTFDAIFLDNAR